ncbi:MAG: hypothetical protein LBS33_00295, partial [Streptococcaceae bacterium]|nr:hypothetical protein [Streptococcaceae bacterium]
MSNNKNLSINLITSVFTFIVTILFSFFLSPYLVKHVGVEANGFVTLANNAIQIISIISIAINSMSSRFITIELVSGNLKKANEYYSSTFFGNVLVFLITVIPVTLIIIFLEKFIQVSPSLVSSVKILFTLCFLNYYLNTCTPNFQVAIFSQNKLYLQSIGTLAQNILKISLICLMFGLLPVDIVTIGIATLVATLFYQIFLFVAKERLLSSLKVSVKWIKWRRLWEIVSSGFWNSINQISLLMLQELDVLIANVLLGVTDMGIIAIVKIVPITMSSLAATLSNLFMPTLTITFAKNDLKGMKKELFKAGKLMLLFLTIPYAGFICFGNAFFKLWMPELDANQLVMLSVISSLSLFFTFGIQPLYQVFGVINRLKENSLVIFASGILTLLVEIILLKTTNLGLIAICGVSSVISILKNMLFVVPFGGKYLGFKKRTFFPLV